MLAVILAKGGPWRAEIEKEKAGQFLAALEKAGAVNVGNADRVAWAAYQRGDAAGAMVVTAVVMVGGCFGVE